MDERGIWRPLGKAAWGLNAARPLAGLPGSEALGGRIGVLIGRWPVGGWKRGFDWRMGHKRVSDWWIETKPGRFRGTFFLSGGVAIRGLGKISFKMTDEIINTS